MTGPASRWGLVAVAVLSLLWAAGAIFLSILGASFSGGPSSIVVLPVLALAAATVPVLVARRIGTLWGIGALIAVGFLFFGTCVVILEWRV